MLDSERFGQFLVEQQLIEFQFVQFLVQQQLFKLVIIEQFFVELLVLEQQLFFK